MFALKSEQLEYKEYKKTTHRYGSPQNMHYLAYHCTEAVSILTASNCCTTSILTAMKSCTRIILTGIKCRTTFILTRLNSCTKMRNHLTHFLIHVIFQSSKVNKTLVSILTALNCCTKTIFTVCICCTKIKKPYIMIGVQYRIT